MQDETEVESTPLADVPKLFYVRSTGIVNGFHNVPIDWFAVRSADDLNPDPPWVAIIEGYEPGGPGYWREKAAVAEMFSEGEARILVDYLQRTDPEGAPIMEPVKLPVPGWLLCTEEWIGAAANAGFSFPLSDRNDYGLPFRVDGYCRLTGRLLIREEKSGGFVVYMDEVPISTPFADCSAAKAWMSYLLGEQLSRFC
jgi:hypothetical protein